MKIKTYWQHSLNSRGSVLTSIMLLSAALGGLSLYLVNVSKYVTETTQELSHYERYLRLHEVLQSKLEDPLQCTNMLAGKPLLNAFDPAGESLLPMTAVFFNGIAENVSSGWRSFSGAFVEDLQINISSPDIRTNIMRDIDSSPTLNVALAEIRLLTREGTPNLESSKFDHLVFKLMIYYDAVAADKNLYSCFGATTQAAVCTYHDGIFNAYLPANLSAELRCEPFRHCRVASSHNQAAPPACSAPYQPKRIGVEHYICEWCNRNI
jgi:hypothetical protein